MKYTFRKYEFTDAASAQSAIDALGLSEEGNPTHRHTIAMLGHIVTTAATYDDDGERIDTGGTGGQLFSRCALA